MLYGYFGFLVCVFGGGCNELLSFCIVCVVFVCWFFTIFGLSFGVLWMIALQIVGGVGVVLL